MPVGSLNVGSAVISVTSKQDTILNPINKNAQQSLYGCSLTVSANSQIIKTLIDGDELNSLLQAIEYIRNVSWSVTALPAFDLSYTTKAGLIVSGFSSKRNGEIEFSIKGNGMQKALSSRRIRLASCIPSCRMQKQRLMVGERDERNAGLRH